MAFIKVFLRIDLPFCRLIDTNVTETTKHDINGIHNTHKVVGKELNVITLENVKWKNLNKWSHPLNYSVCIKRSHIAKGGWLL